MILTLTQIIGQQLLAEFQLKRRRRGRLERKQEINQEEEEEEEKLGARIPFSRSTSDTFPFVCPFFPRNIRAATLCAEMRPRFGLRDCELGIKTSSPSREQVKLDLNERFMIARAQIGRDHDNLFLTVESLWFGQLNLDSK